MAARVTADEVVHFIFQNRLPIEAVRLEREGVQVPLMVTVSCGRKRTAYDDPPGPKRIVMWVPADGFTFRRLDPQPELVGNRSK